MARDIHEAIDWRIVLERLGVDAAALTGRHAPCPGCGGRDRFRFDDRDGRGTWICSAGGAGPIAGDGFRLLEHVYGWSFREARDRVVEVLDGRTPAVATPRLGSEPCRDDSARPNRRVQHLLATATSPDSVQDVVAYLASRFVWPLPPGCDLRAHTAVEYFEARVRIGSYPAVLAPIRDLDDELITAHVTYLQEGRKINCRPARKLLGTLRNRRGCAVRLSAIECDTLGIAEGIETALATRVIHGMPTWAALSVSMLARWEPPQGVNQVVIFADRDMPGIKAARKLRERLEDRATVDVALPSAPYADWADVLAARERQR